MNESYLTQTVSLQKQGENLYTSLQEGKLACGILRTLASYVAIKVDDVDYVVIDTAIEKLADAMNIEPAHSSAILNALINAGLLTRTIEPDHKKEVIPLAALLKLDEFVNFLNSLKSKKSKRMADTFLSDKAIRVGRALALYAKQTGLSITSSHVFEVDELAAKLEKVTGTAFEIDGLDTLIELGLATWEKREGDEICGKFKTNPQTLSRTICNMVAYRKLIKLGEADINTPVEELTHDKGQRAA